MMPPKVVGALLAEIARELETNQPFAERIEAIVAPVLEKMALDRAKKAKSPAAPGVKRAAPGGKRAVPPVLDPVAVARGGERALRDRLATLDDTQLRAIIKYYDMDKTKAASRWRKPEQFVEPIVSLALQRLTKGDVFRGD